MSPSKSLIKAITDAVVTSTAGNVLLNERSFLSYLLEKRRGKPIFQNNTNWNESIRKSGSFIITKWILHIIGIVVRLIVWTIHVLFYLIFHRNRFEKVKYLFCCFWRWLLKRNTGEDLKKNNCGSIKDLLNIHSSPAINLLVIVFFLVVGIVLIVNTATFAINEIMFPQTNLRANNQGVITISQPCMESHSFFLLNSSTFWESTGIPVGEGDKVSFSISGSMYSDVGEMFDAAKKNDPLIYHRSLFDNTYRVRDTVGVEYCIYNQSGRCFGTLLCQVNQEHELPLLSQDQVSGSNKDRIIQITQNNNCFVPKESGILYVSFNDILLTRENVVKILTDTNLSMKRIKDDLLDSKYFTFTSVKSGSVDTNTEYKESLSRFVEVYSARSDSIVKNEIDNTVNQFYDSCSVDSAIWFKDNLGECLVNVRIEKDIRKSDMCFFKKIIMLILREFEHCQRPDCGFWHSHVPIILLFIIIYFVIDIVLSYLIRIRKGKWFKL